MKSVKNWLSDVVIVQLGAILQYQLTIKVRPLEVGGLRKKNDEIKKSGYHKGYPIFFTYYTDNL